MVKILVTGGNQGLGFYLIEYLLTFPNHEVFLGSRSIEKGEEAAKKLRKNSKNDKSSSVKVVQLDVSSDESIRKAAVLDELKQLDVLVNNAGVLAPEEDKTNKIRQILEETYRVNVFGVASMIEAFTPALKKATQKAVIVNVSSELGSISDRLDPDSPYKMANVNIAYNSSKSALNGITAYYANNLPEMRVVAVTPGYCATNLNGFSGPNTPQSGAEVIGKAALDKDGKTGLFLSPGGIFPW